GRPLLPMAKVNARLPCPADGTLRKDVSSNFGVEASNPGSCLGGAIVANFTDGVDTVGGVVPVRTLAAYGLQDDDVFDPYGNQLGYFASQASTSQGIFQTASPAASVGHIQVHDGSGAL